MMIVTSVGSGESFLDVSTLLGKSSATVDDAFSLGSGLVLPDLKRIINDIFFELFRNIIQNSKKKKDVSVRGNFRLRYFLIRF